MAMGKPENITVANVLFDDRFGGPQKRVIEVSEGLRARGIQTVMYLPAGVGNAENMAGERDVEVKRIGFSRIPRLSSITRVVKWVLMAPVDVLRFRSEFIRRKVDIVHVNGAFFITPAIAAKLAGKPLVWHLNDTIVGGVLRIVFGSLVRLMADRIVVAANAVAKHYYVVNSQPKVVYAPVDAGYLASAKSVATNEIYEARRQRITLIANWNPIKGIEYFIDAANLVRKNSGNIEFVLVGAEIPGHEGYARDIEERIQSLGLSDVIVRTGFLNDISSVLAQSDILVLSSISEACPICVLEAMAAGVPVVATDVGGVRELLEAVPGDPAGVIVAPRSGEMLANAISLVLDDKDYSKNLGASGQRIAKKLFDISVCVELHENIYRSFRI